VGFSNRWDDKEKKFVLRFKILRLTGLTTIFFFAILGLEYFIKIIMGDA
tara:strand:+ start:284 stop:430 length:147 start_codon:yes stop_codon:yes gene_type:complete